MMAKSTTYTREELRAFEWLPEDGDFRTTIYPSPALFQLRDEELATVTLCPNIGVDGTSFIFNLTPSGIAERKRLVEMGEIK